VEPEASRAPGCLQQWKSLWKKRRKLAESGTSQIIVALAQVPSSALETNVNTEDKWTRPARAGPGVMPGTPHVAIAEYAQLWGTRFAKSY
jgi:hypothetical protein